MSKFASKPGTAAWAVLLSTILVGGQGCSAEQEKSTAGSRAPLTSEDLKELFSVSGKRSFEPELSQESWDRQRSVVKSLAGDPSHANPSVLYMAARVAMSIGRFEDAAFLFYAAQIRKALDTERFGLNPPDGNNPLTLWSALNASVGPTINRKIMSKPEAFAEVIDRIERWDPVPTEDAWYPEDRFGSPAVPKDEWDKLAAKHKKNFLDEFGRPTRKFLSDPKNAEAMQFVQRYNTDQIDKTPENREKYERHLKRVKSFQSDLAKSRKPDKRKLSMAKMADLYKALYRYAIAHDDNFPQNLGALVKRGLIEPDQLINPRIGGKEPQEDASPEQLAEWANQNSDYVLIEPNKGLNHRPGKPLMHEKIQPGISKGLCIGFGDGHVEYFHWPKARRFLREAGVEVPDALPGQQQESGSNE